MPRDSKRSANDVTVACKLPQGLHVHLKDGPIVKLHGAASPYAVAGYGLTQSVPVDTWEAIKAQHADAMWLTNGFVFANSEHDSVVDEAVEREKVKGGFEAIDPRELPGNIQADGTADPAAR